MAENKDLYFGLSQLNFRKKVYFKRRLASARPINNIIIDGQFNMDIERRNLLNFSEDFTQSVWSKVTMTGVARADILSPMGTLVAYQVTPTLNAGSGSVQYNALGALSGDVTYSMFVRPNGYNYVRFLAGFTSGINPQIDFNCETGEVYFVSSSVKSYHVDGAYNGWLRVSITFAGQAFTPALFILRDQYQNPADGASGCFVFGAQVEYNGLSNYQKIISGAVAIWETNGGWGVSPANNKASVNGGTAGNYLRNNLNLIKGTVYKLKFTLYEYQQGTLKVKAGSEGEFSTFTAAGTYEIDLFSKGDTFLYFVSDGFTGTIMDVSLFTTKIYEDEWTDMSAFETDKTVPNINKEIPTDRFTFGQVKMGNANLILRNPYGEMSDEMHPRSFWKDGFIRHQTQVKITAGFKDVLGAMEKGMTEEDAALYADYKEDIIFLGVLDDKSAVTNPTDFTERIDAVDFLSLADDLKKEDMGNIYNSDVNNLVFELMHRGYFTEFFEVDRANISAGFNTKKLSTGEWSGGTKVMDMLGELAFGHSIFYIEPPKKKKITAPSNCFYDRVSQTFATAAAGVIGYEDGALVLDKSQYIDSGVLFNGNNVKVEADYQFTTITGNSFLFGSRTTGLTNRFGFVRVGNAIRYDYNLSTYGGNTVTPRKKITFENNKTYLDGVLQYSFVLNDFPLLYPLFIFDNNHGGALQGADSGFAGKCWSFKIWVDGVLVRDYIPAHTGQEFVTDVEEPAQFIFKRAVATPDVQIQFLEDRQRIVDIQNYRTGSRGVLERLFWADTGTDEHPAIIQWIPPVSKYKTSKEIGISIITDDAQRQALLNYMGPIVSVAAPSFEIKIPFCPFANLLQKMQILDNGYLPDDAFIIGVGIIGVNVLRIPLGAVSFDFSQNFVCYKVAHDTANTTLTLVRLDGGANI